MLSLFVWREDEGGLVEKENCTLAQLSVPSVSQFRVQDARLNLRGLIILGIME